MKTLQTYDYVARFETVDGVVSVVITATSLLHAERNARRRMETDKSLKGFISVRPKTVVVQ